MNQDRKIPTHGRKDKSVNFGFTHDYTKLFKSGAYLYTAKDENMPSRDPKVSSSTKERFIYFDLIIWKVAREAKGVIAFLKLGPSFLIYAETSKGENSTIGEP